jgi:hypothetical protein
LAGGRKVHGPCEVQQRGFSAAAPSYKRDELASLDVKGNTIERMYGLTIRQIIFRDILERENRHMDSRSGDILRIAILQLTDYTLRLQLRRRNDSDRRCVVGPNSIEPGMRLL